MKDRNLVEFLRGCGVCRVCELRYIKARGKDYNLKESFEQLKIEYETVKDDQTCKKRRTDVCPTCLGLFSAKFQQTLIRGILTKNIDKYECDGIAVAISIPIVLQIRQLAMWYALLSKFGKNEITVNHPPDIPLKEAVKLFLNPIICKQVKKQYDVNGVIININLVHSQEDEEIAVLEKLDHIAFPSTKGKRKEISRGILEKQYSPLFISAELFTKYIPTPPLITIVGLELASVSLTGPTIYVAGRYRKITRQLSHTPWILNGKRIMNDSIEELISSIIAPYFCTDKIKATFMSSGREDVDVRCLGKGRPFALEISNSVRITLPKTIAYHMEKKIEDSLKVSVRSLQIVKRGELFHIKTGEEIKRKYYRALCKLEESVCIKIIHKLKLFKAFEIQQKTPLRVLHRRSLQTRQRSIYNLKVSVPREKSNILVLDIITQAGTYIKELVHGDFGRTAPSIASIIGKPIDIIALDVTGIDLDWPEDKANSI